MARTIELHAVDDPELLPELCGCRVVSTNIGTNGEVIRMWVPEESADLLFSTDVQPGGASFPKTHTDVPYSATVVMSAGSIVNEQKLPLLAATYPMVQIFPDGDVLVVAPRCQHFKDGTHELNARIFNANGVVREFCLGDGIEHVQTDSRGRIWVGYFDEGIFGNFGWGAAKGPKPMGAAGLVCYDREGTATWKFKPTQGLDYIVDCYALNVTGESVWICYYTDFPIVRLDGKGKINSWRTVLRGPRELAVSDTAILAFGGYREDQTNCSLHSLIGDQADKVAEVTLLLPEDLDFAKAQVIGRGNLLYVVADKKVLKFAVPSI